MKGLELNKIASAILIAGIIAMVVGNVADILYQPNKEFKRGYTIETSEQPSNTHNNDNNPEEQIDISVLMANASAEAGQKEFKKCSICHTVTKNGPHRVGPNLWNIVNAPKAMKDKFVYSKAMSDKKGNWTYGDLMSLLISPRKFVPGTKMAFAGYRNPQDAANVIAYLRTLSDKPEALPKQKTAQVISNLKTLGNKPTTLPTKK